MNYNYQHINIVIVCFYIIVLGLSSPKATAQQFQLFNSNQAVLLNDKNDTLSNIFAGGISASQFGKIHLNNDTIADLVVFDKSNGSLSTYIYEKKQFVYHPEYIPFFPKIVNWVLFNDFDKDGKSDIFTHTSLGIKVYRNTTGSNGILNWTLIKNPILSLGFSGLINVQINGTDLPAISDIDNDGDLDILCYNFFNGSQIEYHLNTSMDLFGHCDSLTFKRLDDCWGGFEELSCGNFNFGLNCETGLRTSSSNLRIAHVAPSTLLAIDLDQDGDKDIFESKVGCATINQLTNIGNKTKANFNKVDTLYPDAIKRFQFPQSSASFYEDFDFDNIKDLIVSTNDPINNSNLKDYSKSSWLYKNIGFNNKPIFKFIENNFLQNSMIDIGENAVPNFIDIDADDDLDLIIGNRGKYDSLTLKFYSTIHVYANIGSKKRAIFKLLNNDYLGLSTQNKTSIKPYFSDLNNDQAIDIIYLASTGNKSELRYILNTNAVNETLNYNQSNFQTISGISVNSTDNICFTDLNNDGLIDILLGKASSKIESWIRNAESLSFTISSNDFGGLGIALYRSCPSPMVIDFDRDGNNDILIADNSGMMFLYRNLKNIIQTNSLKNADTICINPSQYSNNKYPFLGFLPSLSHADLDNNGKAEIYLGNAAGGILAFSDTKNSSIVSENIDEFFKVYPNPTFDKTLTFETDFETNFTFFDATGKTIITDFKLSAFSKKEYIFPQLRSGIYLVKIETNFETRVVKVIVL